MARLLKKIPMSRRGWTMLLVLVLALTAWAVRDTKLPEPPVGGVWIDCDPLSESSGLARSRRSDELLWTHNDSGDSPRLFAIDNQGHWRATLDVKAANAIDWEDMCSFTLHDRAYLAVADVGDNGLARKHVTIYGLLEPDLSELKEKDKQRDKESKKSDQPKPVKLTANPKFVIEVTYPHGPVNCEAIAYDPWRQQLILLSKEQWRSQLYAVPLDTDKEKQKVTAELIGTFAIPLATGAVISDDGELLAVATYGPTCLLRRDASIDWSKASSQERAHAGWASKLGKDLELVESPFRRQGEAICFDASGTKLLYTSEGKPTPLITVDCKAGVAGE